MKVCIDDEKVLSLIDKPKENAFIKSIVFTEKNKVRAEYGTEEEAFEFDTLGVARVIAGIIGGKVLEDTKREKEKKTVVKEWVDKNPPSIEEVRKYVEEKDLNVNADEVYKYYSCVHWKDKFGNEIVNWKLKLNTISQINDKKGVNKRSKEEKGAVEEYTTEEVLNIKIENRLKEIDEKIQRDEKIIAGFENEEHPMRKRLLEEVEKLKKEKEYINERLKENNEKGEEKYV